MTVQIGQAVPDFSIPATSNQTITLSELKGKNIVIYFYPKDNTSGCTQEGQDFRDAYTEFTTLNTLIFGVSRDSIKMHEGFKDKQSFPFELLSDKEEQLCQLFDVIKLKKMFGKEGKGIERSTFIIDAQGILRYEWRKVKVKDHVNEVLNSIKNLA